MYPPEDWNDHTGWEQFHASELAAKRAPGFGSFRPDSSGRLAKLITEMRSAEARIWVPGAGRSRFPALLAAFGLEAVATDISPTAVAELRKSTTQVEDLIDLIRSPQLQPSPGRLVVEHHDFRARFEHESFDRIFNIRAFQGFDRKTMAQVADVHAHALRPGGIAYFDTINVQDSLRDQVEECLVDAGFLVPFHQVHRALRAELRATGIPYAEILGMPQVLPVGEYEDGDKRRAARDRLRSIYATAESWFKDATEETRRRLDDADRKLAARGGTHRGVCDHPLDRIWTPARAPTAIPR